MKNFVDLVQSMTLIKGVEDFSLPGRQQKQAALFDAMVEQSGLFLWDSKRKPNSGENRLVVGVNSVSRPDMALFNTLRDWAMPLKQSGVRVEVFNVVSFQSLADFEARMPGLGLVFHTPVAGIWENERWEEKASGGDARFLIHDYMEKVMHNALQKLIWETRKQSDLPVEVVSA